MVDIVNIEESTNVLTRGKPVYTLTTDACNTGWGAVIVNHSTRGLWTAEEKRYHMNYLEILSVFLGLQAFYHSYQAIHIRLMIDNSTAVAVINHMGTNQSRPALNRLCKELWKWCKSRTIWPISAAHIAENLTYKLI